jgi:hypothetical protein
MADEKACIMVFFAPRYYRACQLVFSSNTRVFSQKQAPIFLAFKFQHTVQGRHSTVWSRRLVLPYGTEGGQFVLQFGLGAAVGARKAGNI